MKEYIMDRSVFNIVYYADDDEIIVENKNELQRKSI